MTDGTFFVQGEHEFKAKNLIKIIEDISTKKNLQIFVINRPLAESKYSYDYADYLLILIPKHKIMFLNFGNDEDVFEELVDDFVEDIGSISDKYQYKSVIGRPKKWRDELVHRIEVSQNIIYEEMAALINECALSDPLLQKKSDLLISLLTGSINDIERVKDGIPDNKLDKVKQKIQIFDGDQTRFIYNVPDQKRTTIQGLSGTGKTELLLHKLKDIYLNESGSRILFTCHNKILASSLRKRIPDFFTFMKVEQQIKWQERLWCVHAWGSANEPHSGAYRYICHHYHIQFYQFSYQMSFAKICKLAIEKINQGLIEDHGYAFDYVLLDESQDLPKEFVDLCELVSRNSIYVAGDIFQSIFDENIISEIQPDYLLSKCYRTDPKTLMFAHALGMGLFEKEKLRWLDDEEWQACGYDIEKSEDGEYYRLSRAPLIRFEDIQSGEYESAIVIATSNNPGYTSDEQTIAVIKKIVEENPTVTPDDIGIVFTGSSQAGYSYANRVELMIRSQFGWSVNKAYETKTRVPGQIFISNKNNVKGLEFPFVICASNKISDAPNERNALYMLLTRSFIQSYFLVSEEYNDNEDLNAIVSGLGNINRTGTLVVTAPTLDERRKIKTRIEYKSSESIYDITTSILDELNVPDLWRKSLYDIVKAYPKKGLDYRRIKDIVMNNMEQMDIVL